MKAEKVQRKNNATQIRVARRTAAQLTCRALDMVDCAPYLTVEQLALAEQIYELASELETTFGNYGMGDRL